MRATEPGSLVIGTRGSALALWQARTVAAALDCPSEVKVIETSGDRFLNISLQGRVEKGFFTKEIEDQLLSREIDLAVHSLKDLPTADPPGLKIGAYLPRAATSDLLLVRPDHHDPTRRLPVIPGCKVGATSLRRQALLRCFQPDTTPAFLRGNVPTRVDKCLDGQYGAIVLARAGLDRLKPDLGDLVPYELSGETWLPAPGQGAIAVQTRDGDQRCLPWVGKLDDLETRSSVTIERNLLAAFEGGCHTAFGALARRLGQAWGVRIGMEEEERGWVATEVAGSLEECLAHGPGTLTGFDVPQLPETGLARRL